MQNKSFENKFFSPAFLGDAEQKGVWRTPPIKALLRQWWRVAYAARQNFAVDVATLRRDEAALFGHADDDGANRSLVRLRLDRWDEGKLKKWDALSKVKHSEVPVPVDVGLYLGYGPVTLPKGVKEPQLKKGAAIHAGESAELRLAYPEKHAPLLDYALWLMNRFGTLGGRSRNGWGSFSLTEKEGTAPLQGKLPVRDWKDCLGLDWPHAIGKDEKAPLIWKTPPFRDWKAVMTELAKLKIKLRTEKFPFTAGNDRLWLAYPVTHHNAWGGSLRLPNSLRFKVRPTDQGLVGLIFHVPCLPPAEFRPQKAIVQQVWQQVHQFLDAAGSGVSRSDS
ncbi:MAG: hypothetical protein LBU43_00595 [Candidatus Accumulibacter sp.]|jgi:CRISPR-associated protein Cmr1|nr:hypothetical protein [Accumulibacter sp.]